MDSASSSEEQYAVHKAMTSCLVAAFGNSTKLSPLIRTIITTAATAIHFKSASKFPSSCTLKGSDQELIDCDFVKACLQTSILSLKLVPFPDICISNIWSSSIRETYATNSLRAFIEQPTTDDRWNDAELRELELTALWRGWWGDRAVSFQETHDIALAARLAQMNVDFTNVEGIVGCPLFTRTIQGWREGPLTFESNQATYHKVIAIDIGASGSVSLRLVKATPSRGQPALFTSQDIGFIFRKGIEAAIMSSDELEASSGRCYSPLLQWRHNPQVLGGSDYLATLVQCNWLVTMMGVGVEMSSVAPFHIQTTANLLKRLPSHVQDALKINTEAI
jgi:hypothetical protein